MTHRTTTTYGHPVGEPVLRRPIERAGRPDPFDGAARLATSTGEHLGSNDLNCEGRTAEGILACTTA
ncbi:hypothetical protein [Streptomyces sp. NPDC086787]|uniref:hypothetical protein n=1 Tax=Streptomyces sp. NPDC086787 TaxID=3365759 RepID=UPI003803535B